MITRGSFANLNGNKLASVSIRTSGLIPGYHDLVSICVIVLDGFLKPDKRYTPFHFDIVPLRPENIDFDEKNNILSAPPYINVDRTTVITSRQKLANIATNGSEAFLVAGLLEHWFEKLNLPYNRKLSPISYNWKFATPFLTQWLGGPLNMDYIFDSKYRDLVNTATFLNDYADYHSRPYPYPKIHMSYLCSQLKLPYEIKDDCLEDCLLIAQIYDRMLSDNIIKQNVEE